MSLNSNLFIKLESLWTRCLSS